ncbi:cysteine desulfurase family protein [Chloroflexota bacterium]
MPAVKRKVYLDNVATMPVDSRVIEAMLPFFRDTFGNPVSIHHWGEQSGDAIDTARVQVARLLNALEDEFIFTSGGTEANNLAIKGLVQEHRHRGHHLITSAIEHFSVLHPVQSLEKDGFEVTYLPVDEYGMVNPEDVARSLREDTILVSIMHGNSEVGTIQPIAEIAGVVRESGAIFHTDAVATAGTIAVDVQELGVDALSLAGNQFYGPQGTGALWLRRKIAIAPLLEGGVQEAGKRSGTHNVPGIVGLGKAAELARQEMESRIVHITSLRDKLIEGILSKVSRSVLTGHPQNRLPGHVSFCMEFVEGEAMLAFLDSDGIAAASGSACAATISKSSHTLQAMNTPAVLSQGSLIFSLGIQNTVADINYVLEVLSPIIERLRQISPLYAQFLRGKNTEDQVL